MVNIETQAFIKGSLEVQRVLKKFRDEIEVGIGPILIRSGSFIQAQAQKNAPVLTGTLRRSIHTSNNPEAVRHQTDFEEAGAGTEGGRNIPTTTKTKHTPGKEHMIIVGTWLDYAHGMEIRPIKSGKNKGRHHYMIRAFEAKSKISVAYFYTQLGELLREIGSRAR